MVGETSPLLINYAASATKSNALGPGNRSILWVRGCERHCKGCISPYWWSKQPQTLVSPEDLARRLLVNNPLVEGITISGGEPFLQAEALLQMLLVARRDREFNTIIYSGYTLQGLYDSGLPGVAGLLAEVDVLIDGEFDITKPANDGIRGSLNQEIHFLTDRITTATFFAKRNPLELFSRDGHAFLIGVPTSEQLSIFHQAVERTKGTFSSQQFNIAKGGVQ
ncbi:MAG: 4Fe-4S single cluster domain-containing protein [Anaerolineae bacterium]|jgi:anaerobic ribonucleoside-triphosphate reductase activating protein|nr:4Fe-4S single cluster domain-containing protein [Anaerolineae bacterium]